MLATELADYLVGQGVPFREAHLNGGFGQAYRLTPEDLAALVAFIVGLPTLKLTGYYLGMGTLGFGMIVHILLREWN